MKSFRDPKYVERYEDVVLDLETALNTTVANNANQKKDRYRFVVDNSGEVTPFDWYNARISLDFKVNLLANGGNIEVADHNGVVNGSYSFLKHFDIKLNGKRCTIVMMQITPLMLKIYLSIAQLMPKKQRLMNFSVLIHQDQWKSGNLKLVVQIRKPKEEQLTIKVLPFEKHLWVPHPQ